MPASFPGAVKTFTTKNTADTIEASHINDLQDEVTAIEGGFRNGTAALNSSNSTILNLSVVGGSTMAAINVIVGSTVAAQNVTGALNVGGLAALAALQSAQTTFLAPFNLAGAGSASLGSGNTNDLGVGSTVGTLLLTANAAGSTLTGLAWSGGAQLRFNLTIQLWNVSANPLVLGHQTGSASTGQFLCPGSAGFTVRANGAVWLTYDAAIGNGWRVIAP